MLKDFLLYSLKVREGRQHKRTWDHNSLPQFLVFRYQFLNSYTVLNVIQYLGYGEHVSFVRFVAAIIVYCSVNNVSRVCIIKALK